MTDEVLTTYLGFPLLIREREVVVLTAHGATSMASVKQARLFVRGYRREERNERSAA